jgi:hypothetical protein
VSAPARVPRGVKVTSKGLVLPEKLSFEEWLAVGRQIAERASAFAFAVGDWLFRGQWEYGKNYAEAAEELGFDVGTMRNYASVAGRFDLARRRVDRRFSHHAAVASLDPPTADRLLEQAAKKDWSMRELREAARAERDRRQTPPAVSAPGDDEPDGQHLRSVSPPPPEARYIRSVINVDGRFVAVVLDHAGAISDEDRSAILALARQLHDEVVARELGVRLIQLGSIANLKAADAALP